MSQTNSDIHVGIILEGEVFPEPIRVVLAQSMGSNLKVGGQGLRTKQYHERLLSPDQVRSLRVIPAEAPFDGDALRFRLGIEASRLGLAYEYDPYFSLSIARVDPLPHQLEAVYHYILPLPQIRFLLADDAGAGKTIMAGLLLKELKLRGIVARTLIVVPANLAFQWQREMRDRFRERFDIIRGVDLRNAYGVNPWQDKPQVITSMDWAKREDVLESLVRTIWDLIIVDEAHRMSASDAEHKTERYKLGELLSQKTHHFILLTGTPHKGDPVQFWLFLQLLDRDVYGDVRSLQEAMNRNHAPFYLRRTKEALVTFPDSDTGKVRQLFTNREVRTVRFELDGQEFEFYEALTRYVQDQSISAAADPSARGRALGFTMAMYQRRFASSIHAARRSLERRLQKLEDRLQRPQPEAVADLSRLDEIDELPEDEVACLEEEVEQVSLPSEHQAIQREIEQLKALVHKARALEEREMSSKLAKLREVLTDQNIFGETKTKLLIFTEFKETLDYLVERLGKGTKERPGWGLTVTQIHGGMKIGDRDTPGTRIYAEREFREEAQILVATEAAGEGINLQFCWLMVNFDIPWNPMRLEQRMGRIHRYGQERDCLIFNFVAANTREGQVLERLLERLREIRRELGSDQVFDVVGEIVPANYLERLFRELYAGRVTQQALLERVVRDFDRERFAQICQSTLEGLAKKELNLSAILGRTAEARERRLVPEVVEEFFLQAAPLAGIPTPKGRNGVYTVGRIPRHLQSVGERLEPRFGPLGREYRRITFDKRRLVEDPTLEWVTPGHPLFEAVREEVWEKAQADLRRGAVFYDLNRTAPSRFEVYAASIADGRGNTLHRQLFVVEVAESGEMRLRQPTVFLDLIPAEAKIAVNPPIIPDRGEVERFLLERGLEPFLEKVQQDRQKELDTIARHVDVSLLTLIDRQQRQAAELLQRKEQGEDVALALSEAERRLDELNARLGRRRQEIQRERHLTIADLTYIGSALVLPHPERQNFAPMIRDEEVERIAMEEAMRYERERGWIPEDVSAEDRGFDILSRHPANGSVRFIEVKGRAGTGPVILTRNEYKTAERLRNDYWLYAVFDCATTPRLLPIPDPVRLSWEPIVRIEHYQIDPEQIERGEHR
ncbi:MAG: helicase [Armatimonadota bacterium]